MDKKKKIISLAVVLLLVLAAALALRGLNAGKRKKTSSVSQDIVETVADTGYFTVKSWATSLCPSHCISGDAANMGRAMSRVSFRAIW